MLVKAAKRLGCSCIVLDPTPGSPAGQVAGHQIVGHYHDPAKLRELVSVCDVTTYDIEDVDTETLGVLQQEGYRIDPSPQVLAVVQDKLRQKECLAAAGIATAEFIPLERPDPAVFAEFGYPLVQKARRGGYDGRGVAILRDPACYADHLSAPSLLERFIPATKEIAVLVAQSRAGERRPYPVVEMRFEPGENILDLLLAPARIAPETALAAQALACRAVEAIGGVGIFGVEMFLTQEGELLVNEVAPRTHNSGHYTIEACVTDQFEQHLRALLGLPLGATDLLSPAAMINLLGAPGHTGRPVILGLAAALAVPGVSVHLYGKAATRPYRKMGHVTILDQDIAAAQQKALQIKGLLEITGEDHP